MRAHHLGVGQVSDNLADAPLPWGGQKILLVAKDAGQDHGQKLGARRNRSNSAGMSDMVSTSMVILGARLWKRAPALQ